MSWNLNGDSLDIVYAVSQDFDGALFAERSTAGWAAETWRALTKSQTWGEFRAAIQDDSYSEDEEYPPDDARFSPHQLRGFDDGYYPGPWPPDAAAEWFPEDLIEKYGGECQLTPEGFHLYLPADSAEKIARELRARGHTVEESTDDLPEWISYTYGDQARVD